MKRLEVIKAVVEVALFVPMFSIIWGITRVVAPRFCKNLNTPSGLYEDIMWDILHPQTEEE